jgi:TRAP-type C4-dicarboxylate transport system permease small subunit
LIPSVVFVSAIILLYIFFGSKKRAFGVLGAAFIIQSVGTWIFYGWQILRPQSFVNFESFISLGIFNFAVAISSVVLILIGTIALYSDIKSEKTLQPTKENKTTHESVGDNAV